MVTLAFIVGFVLVHEWTAVAAHLGQLGFSAALLTLLSLAAGLAAAKVLGSQRNELVSISLAFGPRNLAVALLIASTVLRRRDFLAFGTVYLLTHLALLAPFLLFMRRWAAGDPETA